MNNYIINPAYFLKQDGNRVVVCQREYVDPYIERSYDLQNICSFIHPLNAQMLSFFNGEDDIETIIKKMSAYFGQSPQGIKEILDKYIENNETFSIAYNGRRMYFPKNLIIKKQSN